MPIYVYRCPDGHEVEDIQPYDVEYVPCAYILDGTDPPTEERCGKMAHRVPATGLMVYGGDTPTFYPR
jgi:hypothetical protein